jgi:fucose permease
MSTIDTRDSRGPYRTLALACAVFLAAGTMLASLGPSLPFLAERAGQDLATLGWMFTALSAGVVAAQPAVGPAGERFGLRAVLAAGMALMGASMLGVSVARSLPALLGGTLLAGVGFGAVLAAGNVLVARLFARRSASALNGVNVFFGVGSIIGPAIVGLAGRRLGLPQAALWVGGGLMLALTPMVLWLAASPSGLAGHASPAADPQRPTRAWLLGFLLLLYTGTEVGLGGWVSVYMARSAALDPAAAALAASGFWLALTAGRAGGALLGLRLSPRALLLSTLSGLLGGAILLALGVGSYGLSVAGVLLLGLACGPVFPTVLSVITAAAQGGSGAAGLALSLGNSGGLVIPALLGLLLARFGPPAMAGSVLLAAAAMLALGAVALGRAARPAVVAPDGG